MKVLQFPIWIIFGLFFRYASPEESKNVPSSHILYLKGEIHEEMVDHFMAEFHNLAQRDNVLIYIDSPGGSVMAGNKIMTLFENFPVSCIAERAYSMAFAIFQMCENRYVLDHSTLMQHQMFALTANELGKLNSYLGFLNELNQKLVQKQAKRIGITAQAFQEKIYNDWWLTAQQAIKQNVADKIVSFFVV